MIWKISKSSHFKLLIKCFQAIVIKLQREKFFKVALLSYKKMALLALFKTNHTGPSSTGSLGLHQISADIGSPVCSLPKSWDINKPNLFPQITLGNQLLMYWLPWSPASLGRPISQWKQVYLVWPEVIRCQSSRPVFIGQLWLTWSILFWNGLKGAPLLCS